MRNHVLISQDLEHFVLKKRKVYRFCKKGENRGFPRNPNPRNKASVDEVSKAQASPRSRAVKFQPPPFLNLSFSPNHSIFSHVSLCRGSSVGRAQDS